MLLCNSQGPAKARSFGCSHSPGWFQHTCFLATLLKHHISPLELVACALPATLQHTQPHNHPQLVKSWWASTRASNIQTYLCFKSSLPFLVASLAIFGMMPGWCFLWSWHALNLCWLLCPWVWVLLSHSLKNLILSRWILAFLVAYWDGSLSCILPWTCILVRSSLTS